MSFREVRRIPITRGWGPCKRTHWVPVSDYEMWQTPDGFTHTSHWRVGIDPWALGTRGPEIYPARDDIRYVGFRETRPGGPGWLLGPGVERIRDGNWSLAEINEVLDGGYARDRQELEDRRAIEERRTDEYRRRWLALHEASTGTQNRLAQHMEDYNNAMQMPIANDRLTSLRRDAESYSERRRQREEEQHKRDRQRERELRDAALGRRVDEDLEDYGFVPVTPTRRRRGRR
ncbi:uncharacterized protein Z520_12035 [Fonsecaea multimorphosa CBS 102226]|uniref:Uncharacterized protein n=1 Tax=Fonsecaea multimorphosa CBS 102226 TaxID=1442371 RepID=A0A0D2JP90_9EURO|nr:uncharacterized protein Z520_12035 [Fonsecaea multimorphosa CBS 102226]KIX92289.1 hypothetical protein Z520_12035 [Fonsecaea multimorphosa CBS 102226]OAL17659.1 hypothetical protein AYO22_11449 [Fonsecaea multimorphosa]